MESKLKREERLTDKDYLRTTLRAYIFQNGFNYSNYQGTGYANALRPSLKKIYKDDPEGYKNAMVSNMDFYNSNPHLLPFVLSMNLVMEDNKVDSNQIKDMKMALMGPLAGIGDSISQFLLAPLFSTLFASMAADGSTFSPVLFFITMNAVLLLLKIFMGKAGKRTGAAVVSDFADKMDQFTKSASIVGVTVIAALCTQFVKIFLPYTWIKNIGDQTQEVALQSMLDGIAPFLLPVLWTGLVYYLVKKKGWTTYKVIILTVIVAIIGSALGIITPVAPVVS